MTVPPRVRPEGEVEDPLETMLRQTGCIDLHYKVQECMAERQDWRKCQSEVSEFRVCMTKNKLGDKPPSKSDAHQTAH